MAHQNFTGYYGSLKEDIIICALAKSLPTRANMRVSPSHSLSSQGKASTMPAPLLWNLYTCSLMLLFITVGLWNPWAWSHH